MKSGAPSTLPDRVGVQEPELGESVDREVNRCEHDRDCYDSENHDVSGAHTTARGELGHFDFLCLFD